MATTCPAGTTTSDPIDVINTPNNGLNPSPSIPIKVGAPLSSSCERATLVGSIPEVIRHPAFTTVNGAIAAPVKASSGGICNLNSFFKNYSDCYENDNNRLASTCA